MDAFKFTFRRFEGPRHLRTRVVYGVGTLGSLLGMLATTFTAEGTWGRWALLLVACGLVLVSYLAFFCWRSPPQEEQGAFDRPDDPPPRTWITQPWLLVAVVSLAAAVTGILVVGCLRAWPGLGGILFSLGFLSNVYAFTETFLPPRKPPAP